VLLSLADKPKEKQTLKMNDIVAFLKSSLDGSRLPCLDVDNACFDVSFYMAHQEFPISFHFPDVKNDHPNVYYFAAEVKKKVTLLFDMPGQKMSHSLGVMSTFLLPLIHPALLSVANNNDYIRLVVYNENQSSLILM
jgi:hypothetical protein